jgi:heme oxygenase
MTMQLDRSNQPVVVVAERVGTRMQRLRQATRSAHDGIEGALPLLAPGLTTLRYVSVLQALYGFYAALEPLSHRIAGASCAALALETRAKVPLLVADLTVLGSEPDDILALPTCQHLPIVTLPSQAMGVFYVLEGATLGGQSIRRHLLNTLDSHAIRGIAFFTGYGAQTREMWTRLGAHIDEADGLDLDAAVVAATQTFQTLERWLIASLATQ